MDVMKEARLTTTKRPGRPLSFDRDQALEKAMLTFWRTGYETTSVFELTNAMGITAPSLYTAFGDKESLFLECVQKYTNSGPKTASELITEAPSARQAAQEILEFSAHWFTRPHAPSGCLVASAASTGSEASQRVRTTLRQVRQATQKALQKRAELDIREGILQKSANAKSLSLLVIAVIQGMSTLARDGVDRNTLLELARTALVAWPLKQHP